jgi:hypothetical protein
MKIVLAFLSTSFFLPCCSASLTQTDPAPAVNPYVASIAVTCFVIAAQAPDPPSVHERCTAALGTAFKDKIK